MADIYSNDVQKRALKIMRISENRNLCQGDTSFAYLNMLVKQNFKQSNLLASSILIVVTNNLATFSSSDSKDMMSSYVFLRCMVINSFKTGVFII